MPSPIRPAFGQVWQWDGDSLLFLVAPAGRNGEWSVIRINGHITDSDPYPMYGLYSDREPIDGYTLIEGDTK